MRRATYRIGQIIVVSLFGIETFVQLILGAPVLSAPTAHPYITIMPFSPGGYWYKIFFWLFTCTVMTLIALLIIAMQVTLHARPSAESVVPASVRVTQENASLCLLRSRN